MKNLYDICTQADLDAYYKSLKYSKNGFPLDERIRPVKATRLSDGSTITVVSDGKGNAYDCENNPYNYFDSPSLKGRQLISPDSIQYLGGYSGQEL